MKRLGLALCVAVLGVRARAAAPEDPAGAAAALGDRDYDAQRFCSAAEHYERARGLRDDPILGWNAARAWERCGELARARDGYRALLGKPDLDAATRVDTRAALARVDAAMKPPPPPGHGPMEWVALVGGVLMAGGGVALMVYGEGRIQDLADERRAAGGQPIASITRADALARRDEGRTFRLAGGIGAGAGLVVTAIGVGLLLHDGAPAARTSVGASVRTDGWEVACTVRF